MIEELRIRDLGVIADATLPLAPGLTVLTGETGAGKTMVVTALGLLLGARAEPALVRSGASAAAVEGVLRVDGPGGPAGGDGGEGTGASGRALAVAEEAGAEVEDGALLLVRSVPADGRARAWVGGRGVPVSVLGAVTGEQVTVHGQSDQLRLRSTTHQRALLDGYAGEEHAGLLQRYRDTHVSLRAAEQRLARVVADARERAQEAETLRLRLAEHDRVAPEAGEEESLREDWDRLAHAEELRAAATSAVAAVAGDDDGTTPGAQGLLAEARAALDAVRHHDPGAAELADRVTELAYLASDLGTDLAGYASGVDADPGRLAAVEARRHELAPLLRAHGDLAAAVAWAATARERLDELDDEGLGQRLQEEVDAARGERDRLAGELRASRAAAAQRLSGAVTAELALLALARARLVVDVVPAEPGPDGADDVAFLLAGHSGAEPRPLARAASGGELSRVMLALEVVTAAGDGPGTFVFDEVDAGVGGEAAVEIGRRLAALATGRQVVVVTHLPQVAAFADSHLVVRKDDDGRASTVSHVDAVTGDERVREVARMLAGMSGSSTALAHAAELLTTAAELRQAAGRVRTGPRTARAARARSA